MNDFIAKVDTREPAKFFAALDTAGVHYERVALDVADVQIWRGNELIFTFERKTWYDMEASCVDGRFSDQLLRACTHAAERGGTHCIILEHASVPSDRTLRGEQKRDNRGLRARSAIDRCVLQHGIGVLRTADTTDTARLIFWILQKSVAERWLPDTLRLRASDDATPPHLSQLRAMDGARRGYYGGAIRTKKSGNDDTPEACWVRMLQVVRGVSEDVARAIARDYPTVGHLTRATPRTRDGVAERLAKVACGKRRVGPTVARRIANCMMEE